MEHLSDYNPNHGGPVESAACIVGNATVKQPGRQRRTSIAIISIHSCTSAMLAAAELARDFNSMRSGGGVEVVSPA